MNACSRRSLGRALLAVVTTWLLLSAEARGADVLRVLLVDGQNNHDWRRTSPLIEETLEATGRFAVEVATTPASKEEFAKFSPPFAEYDVVVSNYNGEPWPEATRDAFERYVREGGGFVAVHAANNAFPGWPEYNRIIGVGGWGGRNEKSGPYVRWRDGAVVRDEVPGGGGSHGRQHEFVVEARADHPILAGLPPRWLHGQDELYDRLRGPAESLTVLATAFADKAQGGSGEHEPMLMVIDYGKGRCFHTTLGHGVRAMECVGFQETLARGTEWAATGKVSPRPLPADFPTAEKAVYRAPARDWTEWTSLFDGTSLKGWSPKNGNATYRVEDGSIVGKTGTSRQNTFLCSDRLYGDFELELEVLLDGRLNSGIQIRSNSFPEYRRGQVHGYQVEIANNGTAGFIYDEGRRGWLSLDRSDPKAQAAFRDGEWNRYRILCLGDRIRTWVNDVPVADLRDTMTATGFIGLQVHSIPEDAGPFEVRWRNLRLREVRR